MTKVNRAKYLQRQSIFSYIFHNAQAHATIDHPFDCVDYLASAIRDEVELADCSMRLRSLSSFTWHGMAHTHV